MSDNSETTTTWQSDPRFRYLVPVIILLGLLLLLLAIAASCNGRDNNRGLKPFRSTREPFGNVGSGDVVILSFTDLNNDPVAYQNQRIRVTGDKITIQTINCRLYTGPVFTWGLIGDDLQLTALGFEKLVNRLPDGLTMTVEGVWRQYNGPLGCGKEPVDGSAWYLQVERIIAPNPLPLMDGTPFATIQVPFGTQNGVEITPFATRTPETAVTDSPGIGITPLPPGTSLPIGTQPPTVLPTATTDGLLPTETSFPGLTPTATPIAGATETQTSPDGTSTVTMTPTAQLTPSATSPGIITQTPAPTKPGYPGPGPDPSTPVPGTATPYPGS